MHFKKLGAFETAIGGGQYMLLFTYDTTCHMDEYILQYKSEVMEKFKERKNAREKQSGQQVKQYRTDGSGEYTSKKFTDYLKLKGILMAMTMANIPQFRGVIKCANRTIIDHGKHLQDNAGLWKSYWVFAILVVVCLRNYSPPRLAVHKTPCKPCPGMMRVLMPLLVFRFWHYLHIVKEIQPKLYYRATASVIIGCCILSKQLFMYNPFAKMLHWFSDMVFRERKWFPAPNAADETILNKHFYSNFVVQPMPTMKKSETSQPIEKQPTECQMAEKLQYHSPPDPPKPNTKMSAELAYLQTSIGDPSKLPAKGSRRNHPGMYHIGTVCPNDSWRWGIQEYDSHPFYRCNVRRSWWYNQSNVLESSNCVSTSSRNGIWRWNNS